MTLRAPRNDAERCTATTDVALDGDLGSVTFTVRCRKLAGHNDSAKARENLDPFHGWETSDRETGIDRNGVGRDQAIRITWARS
ncbi:MAG: hypothetical protein RR101_15165 [Burkholderiaceae bacterium]